METSTHKISLLRISGLCKRYQVGSSSIRRKVANETLPPPVKLGPRSSVWPEHEIDQILTATIAGATDEDIRTLVKELVAQRTAQYKRAAGGSS